MPSWEDPERHREEAEIQERFAETRDKRRKAARIEADAEKARRKAAKAETKGKGKRHKPEHKKKGKHSK